MVQLAKLSTQSKIPEVARLRREIDYVLRQIQTATNTNAANITVNFNITVTTSGTGTDNRMVRWDGTGTNSIQDSGVTLDDSDNATGFGTINGVTVEDHDARHERGGADEIDGDHLDVDFTPSNYTPSTAPAEAANVDDLAAHLAGIDDALGAAVTDHGALTGLTPDDDHPQYLLVDGSRAMSGDLNMGTNAITNVGLVDGVDVSAHAARHSDGGADEITVEDLATGSITTTHVLSPDGLGGLVMRAETTGTSLTGLGTDNRLARWNGTDTVQDSAVVCDDTTGLLHGVDGASQTGASLAVPSAAAGPAAVLAGGAGTSGNAGGGNASLLGGDADGSGTAGGAYVTGGSGGTTGTPGPAQVTGGDGGTVGAGATVLILGGSGGSTSGDGGPAYVTGGAAQANNDDGGDVEVSGGARHGTGVGGSIVLTTADGGIVRIGAGALALGPVSTAAAFAAGNNNDWSPAGHPDHIVWQVSANAAGSTLTGIAAPATTSRTQILVLHNTSSNVLTIAHNSASSSAGNRIFCLNSTNITLRIYGTLVLFYGGSNWRTLSQN